MNAAGRKAAVGSGILGVLAAGIVIGLASSGSAAEDTPSVETTETSVVQVQVTETLPPATVAAPAETPAPAASPEPTTVIVVTDTPKPAAPAPAQPAETTEAEPVVTQAPGIVVGPSTSPDAGRAPQAPVGVAPTGEVNGGNAG